jgi:hypothetical protein
VSHPEHKAEFADDVRRLSSLFPLPSSLMLKHLLFWPITGPTFLARFSIEKVQEATRRELTEDDWIKEELLALQMELELDEVTEDEYAAREAELMQRLREVREWREFFGMETRGGPVRVAGTEAADPDGSGSVSRGIASPGEASVELGWDEPG